MYFYIQMDPKIDFRTSFFSKLSTVIHNQYFCEILLNSTMKWLRFLESSSWIQIQTSGTFSQAIQSFNKYVFGENKGSALKLCCSRNFPQHIEPAGDWYIIKCNHCNCNAFNLFYWIGLWNSWDSRGIWIHYPGGISIKFD